ncbi:MAG: hypothetical protein ACRDLT_06810 [Solirubrobacteraceae bacterium]
MDINFLVRAALSHAAVRAITFAARERQTPRLRLGLRRLTVWAVASALL